MNPETGSRLVVTRGQGKGNGEQVLSGHGVPLGGIKMFQNLAEVVFAGHCKCTECH